MHTLSHCLLKCSESSDKEPVLRYHTAIYLKHNNEEPRLGSPDKSQENLCQVLLTLVRILTHTFRMRVRTLTCLSFFRLDVRPTVSKLLTLILRYI
jgi:hypothetical protein